MGWGLCVSASKPMAAGLNAEAWIAELLRVLGDASVFDAAVEQALQRSYRTVQAMTDDFLALYERV
jgi:hypothetical protein